MEFTQSSALTVVLPIAFSLLSFLGFATSAGGSVVRCPLIAPLSSYSPSIPSMGSSPVTSQVVAELESIVSSFVANNSIPLYAVSVVHEDQMVFTSGLDSKPFMIGSVTKTFSALGALILRERGLLSLDDPVKKFLPNFTIINPYEPHDITLRELMGHVSGLPRELCNNLFVANQSEAQCPAQEADVLTSIAQMQLVRPPWSREPAYSNLGFALLGHSWEKATCPSKSWDEFLVEEILQPLGMNSSGMDWTNVTLVTNESAANYDIGWVGPAGNMHSTATDLAKYLIFLLKAQPAVLSGATVREWINLRTTFPDGNGGFGFPWELQIINSTGREFLITKSGGIKNYVSYIAIQESTQLGVSALFAVNDSSLNGPFALIEEILNHLVPLIEKETSRIIDPLYTGHYVCKATPPSLSQPLNVTVEVLGGSIDIAGSPSLGLSAAINLTLLYGGQPFQEILTSGMLLKNSTQNSFWLDAGDNPCLFFFGAISAVPSTTNPNHPGTDYFYEIQFDFPQKTVVWPAASAVCVKQ